jgi:hypothetical protein
MVDQAAFIGSWACRWRAHAELSGVAHPLSMIIRSDRSAQLLVTQPDHSAIEAHDNGWQSILSSTGWPR